jgi:hypothetical protein
MCRLGAHSPFLLDADHYAPFFTSPVSLAPDPCLSPPSILKRNLVASGGKLIAPFEFLYCFHVASFSVL